MQSSNTGFVFRPPQKGDYIRDGRRRLAGLPINPSGQWDAFLPPGDPQNLAMEPMACASFGTLHAIEMLERQEFGDTTEWSRRFLAKLSGTTTVGNDPHTVAETLRNMGDVFETEWPYTTDIDTWEKFYKQPSYDLVVKAEAEFKGKYDFGHQYVRTDVQSMMNALQSSPLGVDVYAWQFDTNTGYAIRPPGTVSEHWVVCYGFVEGQYWKVFDSYNIGGTFLKKLSWDYGFSMVKEYTLHKQVLTTSPLDPMYLWAQAIRYFRYKLQLI